MFEPRHLKAYLALVKCMHFGRAAEMLGISQPTLSQQIRMLEEAVGAPLINRSNRTMELTPVGRVFAEDAQQILTLMERAKRNAEDILSGEEAEVKLGVCPGTISSGFLINLLAESRRRWPRIKVLTEVSPPSSFREGAAGWLPPRTGKSRLTLPFSPEEASREVRLSR